MNARSEERPAPINASACYVHHPIHEARPDIGVAAHTHTRWGTPFSAEAARIAREDLTQGDFGWDLFGWATRRHLSHEFA